ncbi:MAG: hypothetical protein ACI85O_001583 [Saprospiraceae bacterium]|jgi:hypothetical protein
MKNITTISLLTISLFLTSCQQRPDLTEKLDEMEAELIIAKQELADLKTENDANPAGSLVHLVYLNLKDDLKEEEKAEIIAAIDDLARIEEVNELEIGDFANLGDARAMSDLEMVFSMSFTSKLDYEIYQGHPIHLQLKTIVKPYLSGPPVTYDYIRRAG